MPTLRFRSSRRLPAGRTRRRPSSGPPNCCSIAPTCWVRTSPSPTSAAATPRPSSPRRDPLTGEAVEVLWVKGSGGDIGSMKLDGFSTLYLDKLLRPRSGSIAASAHEDEMVGYLPHCTFNLNPRAASIDTPLHGLPAVRPRRPRPPRRDHRAGRLLRRRGGDAGDLGRRGRLAALEAAGLRPRRHAARLRGGQPRPARRDARRPRDHLLGRHVQGLLREHHRPDRRRGAPT